MSKALMPLGHTPECCDGCQHLDWTDHPSDRDVAYCLRGLIFPTKKQACALRNKPKQAAQQQERDQ